MSESNSTIDLGFEARLAHVVGTAQKWDRGVHPDELVKAIRELREYFYQRTADDAPARIGPTEPDDTMVICPVCTSQFRAIPLDVQRVRDELLAVAKRYAAECRLCGGHGVRRRLDLDGTPLDDVSCEQCADVRLVIARAEGRSDE